MKMKIKNKKGFISIEAIYSLVLVMMVIFVAVGFFSYMYPKIAIEKQVHLLAEKAKIQGGLTDETSQPVNSDISEMLDTLEGLGFDKEDIKITATTDPGDRDVIGVTPIDQEGDNYVKRNSKEVIVISVTYPSNKFIAGPLKYFKVSSEKLRTQTIQQSVLSERW